MIPTHINHGQILTRGAGGSAVRGRLQGIKSALARVENATEGDYWSLLIYLSVRIWSDCSQQDPRLVQACVEFDPCLLIVSEASIVLLAAEKTAGAFTHYSRGKPYPGQRQ